MAAQTLRAVVSGTVGQKVLAAGRTMRLVGYSLVGSGAVRMQIRHGILGGASAEVVWEDRAATSAGAKYAFGEGDELHFSRGLHITILGTGGTAYLLLK